MMSLQWADPSMRGHPMRRSANPVRTTGSSTPTSASLLLRMKSVIQVTGLARSTIYKLMAQDKFPSPVRLVGRAVAWRRVDLERWTADRPTVTH